MFELSVAWKYLLPKRRQLSVSIISLISVLVISLVIWLILVFFSVTKGLEKGWVEKLITLTAPIRISPKDPYFHSYDYQIDQHSMASGYSVKTLGEKAGELQDPYNPDVDEELPSDFPKPLIVDGKQIALVPSLFEVIEKTPGIIPSEYEVTSANLRLRLLRNAKLETTQAFLSQPVYLGTFEGKNPSWGKTVLPFNEKDLFNAFRLLNKTSSDETSDAPTALEPLAFDKASERKLLASKQLTTLGPEALSALNTKVYEPGETPPFYALYRLPGEYQLPYDPIAGYGVLAPKSFRDAGTLLGDRGFLSYYAPTASTLQEQRIPIFIAGFYDPGIVPLGGKFILGPKALVHMIRSGSGQEMSSMTNGINIRFDNLSNAESVKKALEKGIAEKGMGDFWKVETFREYDYAKDLLEQLSSEKNIFSLISAVIIIVACSNIISMLIILVNDKRTEIGILRSMGATSASIALIFGTCGFVMGILGTVIGSVLAFFTLRHLNSLLSLISRLQGFDAFNPVFYGDHLPNSMSYETLIIVFLATGIISLIAGLVPAIKAAQMKPAAILRSE